MSDRWACALLDRLRFEFGGDGASVYFLSPHKLAELGEAVDFEFEEAIKRVLANPATFTFSKIQRMWRDSQRELRAVSRWEEEGGRWPEYAGPVIEYD